MIAIAAVSLGGCSSLPGRDVTGSIAAAQPAPQSEADWRKVIEVDGPRYRADPKDAAAALRYGQALRATGQRAQAAAVLEQAAIANPGDRTLLAAYGRALVDNGNYQQGFDTLTRAHTPDNPDWHILSIQGTALDRLGRHDEARRYYTHALKIRPDEPTVLSNLGMSYVLSKQLPRAEETLRRAHDVAPSDIRVTQNLALAIGLQGRAAEAETIVSAGLPPQEASESIEGLRAMLRNGNARRSGGKQRAEIRTPARS
jgi:Flp pilus assembly protein TadD